eukprot:2884896-Pyramimonas_sp.AAC.1
MPQKAVGASTTPSRTCARTCKRRRPGRDVRLACRAAIATVLDVGDARYILSEDGHAYHWLSA